MGGYREKKSIVGEEHGREPGLDDVMSAGIRDEATGGSHKQNDGHQSDSVQPSCAFREGERSGTSENRNAHVITYEMSPSRDSVTN